MTRRSALFLAAAIALVCPGRVCAEETYDLLIRNARVVDGTGNPWFYADVGVRGGVIATVGRLAGAQAVQTIDAKGRVVAPGFVDVHTHVEGGRRRKGIEDLPDAANFVLDGVTTIVTGNCGSSRIRLAAWFQELEKTGLGLNLASLIGHNSVRRTVMGAANRPASPAELDQMKALIQAAMNDGAVGFSTGLLYVPGTYADTAEVVALAQAAAENGGVYASHIREQGGRLLESILEAATVAREAGMPVQISHLKIKGKSRWGTIGQALDLIGRLRAEGLEILADAYPYDRASTSLSVSLPAWAFEGGEEEFPRRLSDPPTRRRIIEETKRMLEEGGFPDFSFATVARYEPDPSLEGKTISQISVLQGRQPGIDGEIETILEMLSSGGAQMVYGYMSMNDVERILSSPYTAVASDGGVQEPGRGKPHPRSYGCNARALNLLTREKQLLSLEDAVRKMSSLPARAFGFLDRGVIRPGLAADLVLFDPALVEDRAAFEDPHQYARGFEYVFVNGVAVVSEGKPTGRRPGLILRRAGQ